MDHRQLENDNSLESHRDVTPPPSKPSRVPPQMTPIQYKMSSQTAFMPNFHRMDQVYNQVRKDTIGYYAVGMKPSQFFEKFMPWNKTTPKHDRNKRPDAIRLNTLRSMASLGLESDMYPKFISALTDYVTVGTEGEESRKLLFLRSTSGDKECNKLNIDISTYLGPTLPTTCKFSMQQTQEEFKRSHLSDPFIHVNDESLKEPGNVVNQAGERNTEAANKTRGQIAAYAGVALSMAPRTHLFSVIFCGQYARFIRWDRRGAVVTHCFDYAKHPKYVFDFYRRFGQLSLQERGFDPTFKVFDQDLPETALNAFNKYLEEAWDGGVPLEEVLYSSGKTAKGRVNRKFYTVEVKDAENGRSETFLVPEPMFHARCHNPFNRATRRSLAYPCTITDDGRRVCASLDNMCFIKESWQEISHRTPREADIYRRLKKHDVQHVASMRLGGDVEGLVTKTQEYFANLHHAHRFSSLPVMVCHRLVLETVARDLSSFGWAKVLFSCIADAVVACQQAYKAGILHRDISAGNVMITKDSRTGELRGLLVDWDMCCIIDMDPNFDPTDTIDPRSGRTGKWAFISVGMLSPGPQLGHTLADDLESFFWVIVYMSLRYLQHNFANDIATLSKKFNGMFSFEHDNEQIKLNKLLMCAIQTSQENVAAFVNHLVNELLHDIAPVFCRRYRVDFQFNITEDVNLDNPNDLWLSNVLYNKAHAMAPMNITRTALKSPTNDSNPPSEEALWQSADRKDAKLESQVNEIVANTGLTPATEVNVANKFALSTINHMDGISGSVHGSLGGGSASTSSKRRQKDKADGERKGKGKKRRRV